MAKAWGRSCSHPRCPEIIYGDYWLCDKHNKQRWKKEAQENREKNPVERKFYNSREWELLSRTLRAKEPFCRECARQGKQTFGDLTDHIIPLKIAWHMRLDPTNCQTMCHPCHNRKRALEAAMYSASATAPPCTIVCGPPGSGKTTFVKENAKRGDLIIDLDAIYSAISNLPMHDKPASLLPIALEAKSAIIHRAVMMGADRPRMWIITSGALSKEREQYRAMFNATIVVLETQARECFKRIASEPSRANTAETMRFVIDEWWNTYERVKEDTVYQHE